MAYRVRNMQIKVNTGSGLQVIGGMQAKSFAISRDLVDITTFPTTTVNAIWRELLPNMNSNVSISGTCIFKDDVGINLVSSLAESGDLAEFQLEFENGDTVDGEMAVTSFSHSGEYLDAHRAEMTLEGSGTIVRPVTYADLVIASGPYVYYEIAEPGGIAGNQPAIDTMGVLDGLHTSFASDTLGQQPLKIDDPKTSAFYYTFGYTDIDPPPSSPLHSAGDMAVELIFQIPLNPQLNWKGLVMKGTGGVTEYSINAWQAAGLRHIYIENDNGASFFSPGFELTAKRHLAVNMASSGAVDIYLDGSYLSSGTMNRLGSTTKIALGEHIKYAYPARGYVSDVAIYTRLMNTTEILSHANKALVG